MAILSYFQIFLGMFTCAILYFIPGLVTYKTMALIIAVVSSLALVWILTTIKRKVDIILVMFFILALIIVLYNQTKSNYSVPNEKYASFFLVLAGRIAPSFLCAIGVAQLPKIQYRIKQYAPYVGGLFTFISFVAAFFPDSETSGGFVATESGLNYQTTSYLAAYATGLNFYYILNFSRIKWVGFVRSKKYVKVYFILIVINLMSILIAGGRGGLLLFMVQSLFAYWLYSKNNVTRLTSGSTLRIIIVVVLLVVIGINFAGSFGGSTNGFSRIVNTVENQDENGRDVLRALAIVSFLDSPVTGHGLGSVFYEVGEYSHNCITDALVEIGIVGALMFIGILFLTWKKNMKLINLNTTNALWHIFFLDGLVMSFFSGYYLAHQPVWWIVGFSLSFSMPKIHTQSQKNRVVELYSTFNTASLRLEK